MSAIANDDRNANSKEIMKEKEINFLADTKHQDVLLAGIG